MKYSILGVITLAFVSVLYINLGKDREVAPTPAPAKTDTVAPLAGSTSTYEDASLGLSFAYKTGADGYTLFSGTPERDAGQVAALMLVHENERPMVENPVAYSEGPINISINVFENSAKQFPRQWAEAHTPFSNIQMVVGDVTETVVGGANAISYTVDGLYRFDTVVVAHGSKVYVLAASYHDTTTPTYRDFRPLLSTVRFVLEPGQQ